MRVISYRRRFDLRIIHSSTAMFWSTACVTSSKLCQTPASGERQALRLDLFQPSPHLMAGDSSEHASAEPLSAPSSLRPAS
jgi:hypothetical protein